MGDAGGPTGGRLPRRGLHRGPRRRVRTARRRVPSRRAEPTTGDRRGPRRHGRARLRRRADRGARHPRRRGRPQGRHHGLRRPRRSHECGRHPAAGCLRRTVRLRRRGCPDDEGPAPQVSRHSPPGRNRHRLSASRRRPGRRSRPSSLSPRSRAPTSSSSATTGCSCPPPRPARRSCSALAGTPWSPSTSPSSRSSRAASPACPCGCATSRPSPRADRVADILRAGDPAAPEIDGSTALRSCWLHHESMAIPVESHVGRRAGAVQGSRLATALVVAVSVAGCTGSPSDAVAGSATAPSRAPSPKHCDSVIARDDVRTAGGSLLLLPRAAPAGPRRRASAGHGPCDRSCGPGPKRSSTWAEAMRFAVVVHADGDYEELTQVSPPLALSQDGEYVAGSAPGDLANARSGPGSAGHRGRGSQTVPRSATVSIRERFLGPAATRS